MTSPLSKIEQAKVEPCGLDLAPRLEELGRQGWEMTDTSQVGPLLMFFFKRPLRPTPKLIAAVRRKGDAAGSPRDAQPEQPS